MLERTEQESAVVIEGKPTDHAVIEEAFVLWVASGRSAKAVAELVGCDPRTVRNWRDRYGWEEKRAEGMAGSLAPTEYETRVSLRWAGYYASKRSQYLMWRAAEEGIPADPKEMAALAIAIDRAGHSPVGRNKLDTDNPNAQPAHLEELTGLTTAELIAREREYASRSNPPRPSRDR